MRHLSCCLSLLTQASGIQNPFLFSVPNDHHCNEAYDWWPIADLWSIKCVLSAPGWPHHPSYWHLTLQSPRACSTHYSSTLQAGVTAAANGHTRAVKILSAPTTWDVVKTKLVTCLKTKFKWWNFSTFVFIEKVLANDHIIYITFGSKTSSHLNYGGNFNHTICFKCHRIHMLLVTTKLLSCQFYFNSTNYKKPQIVTDLLNIGPSKTFTKKLRTWINSV